MRRGTVAVRGYRNVDPYGSLHPPIYQTAVFRMEGGPPSLTGGSTLSTAGRRTPP